MTLVLTANRFAVWQSDLPLEAPLNNRNLTREDHHPVIVSSALRTYAVSYSLSELSLDVEPPKHGDNHEVTVAVDERLLVHVRITGVDVNGDALTEHRAAVTQHRLDTIDEVDLLVGGRLMRTPRELCRGYGLLRIEQIKLRDKLRGRGSS